MNTLLIGIDPGKKTGISLYSPTQKSLMLCETLGICQAMDTVTKLQQDGIPIEVYFEDARLRKWIPKSSGREVLQGAGSIKRDCSIWEEFCIFHGIECHPISPKDNMTKLNAKTFQKITGWSGKTSEHSRDSGMLVFGR
jgi:hypothetical protein